MKKNILKSLILTSIISIIGSIPVPAEELEETITLSVSPSFVIQKKSSSINTATATAGTGEHTGMCSVYDIVTNGTDYDYDITISSSLICDAGEVSAYSSAGALLFANETYVPTESDVNNARLFAKENDNVIAYPVSASITTPMTISFDSAHKYGPSYVIKLNNGTSGTLNFVVQGTPVANTYSSTRDIAGTYKSTITITVTPKS